MNYLYHGSSVQGLKVLEPRMITKRSDQKKPRVYAATNKAEAAVFACPFNGNNSRISWHGKMSKMQVDLFNKKLLHKYPASVYVVSPKHFVSVDSSNIEWYAEKPVEVIKEIKIKDAIAYARRNGIKIKVKTR